MKFLPISFVSLFSFTATATTTTAATSIDHHDVHVFENQEEAEVLLVVNPFSRSKKTIGEHCSDDRECITRYCIGSNDLEKVCLKSWGSKCESDEECGSQYCSEESTTCDFKIEGSPCTDDWECESDLCGDNEICVLAEGKNCLSNEVCASGFCGGYGKLRVCQLKYVGSKCMSNSECFTDICSESVGKCVKGEGGSCLSDEECETGYCKEEEREDLTIKRTCSELQSSKSVKSQKGEGEKCSSDEECASNWCDQGLLFKTCKLKDTGSECQDDYECKYELCRNDLCVLDDGYFCHSNEECVSGYCHGLCQTLKAEGENCRKNEECESKSCQKTYGLLPTCQPMLKEVGSECTFMDECARGFCIFNLGSVIGTCVLNDGEECTSDEQCMTDYCRKEEELENKSTCQVKPKGQGEFCKSDKECESGRCAKNGHLTITKCEFKSIGSNCDNNAQCLSGICNDGICMVGEGESCWEDETCVTGYCSKARSDEPRTCQVFKEAGVACKENSECLSGDCSRLGICKKAYLVKATIDA